MAAPVIITIAGAPVPKGRPRLSTFGGHARAYTPQKTRRYEDLIRLEAGRIMEGRDQLQGPLFVRVAAFMPIPKSLSKAKTAAAIGGELRPQTKPDVDNFAKVIDALNGIAWHDDSQVVHMVVSKHYSDRPRLELLARELSNDAPSTKNCALTIVENAGAGA
jgi:Holliday junction resolvase RusA-like endonuclease